MCYTKRDAAAMVLVGDSGMSEASVWTVGESRVTCICFVLVILRLCLYYSMLSCHSSSLLVTSGAEVL